jgi:hypothetical protein
MKTMKSSTEEWIDSQAEWVGNPLHAPAVAMLLLLAEQIDADPQKASLISQYGLAYRSLIAERPKEDESEDALDLLLRNSVGEGVAMGA